MESFGPFCFGLVIGWITYRTLRRKVDDVALGDIAGVIGAVGGAAIVALFKNAAFDAYSVGLAAGFFSYLVMGMIMDKREIEKSGDEGGEKKTGSWMGGH